MSKLKGVAQGTEALGNFRAEQYCRRPQQFCAGSDFVRSAKPLIVADVARTTFRNVDGLLFKSNEPLETWMLSNTKPFP